MAPLGNLVRLLPLNINELPAHAALDSLLENTVTNHGSAGSSPSKTRKLGSSERPKRDSTASSQSERPNLITFVEEVLEQATIFVEDILPTTFKKRGLKDSAPAAAKVELLSRDITMAEIHDVPWINSSIPRNWSGNKGKKPAEAWFARRSRHVRYLFRAILPQFLTP